MKCMLLSMAFKACCDLPFAHLLYIPSFIWFLTTPFSYVKSQPQMHLLPVLGLFFFRGLLSFPFCAFSLFNLVNISSSFITAHLMPFARQNCSLPPCDSYMHISFLQLQCPSLFIPLASLIHCGGHDHTGLMSVTQSPGIVPGHLSS